MKRRVQRPGTWNSRSTRKSMSASIHLLASCAPLNLTIGAREMGMAVPRSVELGNGQQRPRPQRQRILDPVGGSDATPHGGVAVVHGGNAVKGLPRLDPVGAMGEGRARGRVLRPECQLLLVLGERQVGLGPKGDAGGAEVGEVDAERG